MWRSIAPASTNWASISLREAAPRSASTQQFSTTATGSGSSLTVSDPLNIFLYNAKLNVGLTVKDLEQKQILQVLAEPTLTTLSGLPAHFLSGGEFPFPVVQGGTGEHDGDLHPVPSRTG